VTSQTDTTTKYTRLSGSGHRPGVGALIFSRCRLYLGHDHVLSLETKGFTESYRRFYFPDIQAIVTIKTRKWNRLNVILPLVTSLLFILTMLVGAGPGKIALAAVGIIFLAVFLQNLLRGPTCDCYIMTAVQKEQLPSLGRVRTANKVIAMLSRSVEAVQGTLDKAALISGVLNEVPVSSEPSAEDGPVP
jgi:hypothetical protein